MLGLPPPGRSSSGPPLSLPVVQPHRHRAEDHHEQRRPAQRPGDVRRRASCRPSARARRRRDGSPGCCSRTPAASPASSGSTKTLLRNVSGKITIMLTPITDFSVRSIRPNIVQIHEKANENTSSSATPASTPGDAAVRPVADDDADDEHHGRGQEVAHDVAEQIADHRRRPPDRQRAEAVEHALRDVGVDRDARVHRDHHDAHDQDPGQQELDVLLRWTRPAPRRRGT